MNKKGDILVIAVSVLLAVIASKHTCILGQCTKVADWFLAWNMQYFINQNWLDQNGQLKSGFRPFRIWNCTTARDMANQISVFKAAKFLKSFKQNVLGLYTVKMEVCFNPGWVAASLPNNVQTSRSIKFAYHYRSQASLNNWIKSCITGSYNQASLRCYRNAKSAAALVNPCMSHRSVACAASLLIPT